jgi:hypothetical protein
MVSGKMRGGLGVSSWLLIAITILAFLQLFSMAGVSGAQMLHQPHGNCLKDQNDLFECLVVPSCKEAEVVPTPSIPNTSPPPPIEKPPFNSEGQGGELP